MKYIGFAIMLLVGVPIMVQMAMRSEKERGWLVTLLIFSTILSTTTKINFVSMEHYRGPDRGFEINLTDLTAWALIISFLIRWPERIQWLPYNWFLLAALYGIALISALGAPDLLVASFALFKWARGAVIYWCVVNCVRIGFPKEAIWRAHLGMAWYLTFLAVKQKYIDHMYRINGPFDHSNTVPLFLNQFLPVLLLWGVCDRRLTNRQAASSVGATIGLIVASQSTFSRLGLMLSLVGFAGALVVANMRWRSRRVKIATLSSLVAVVIGGILAAPSIINRIQNAPESSEEARKEFNLAARAMTEDHPFGVGINNFSRVLTADQRYNKFITVMEDEEQSGVCHHIYNLTSAELGKPGLYVFVLILISFLVYPLWVALRKRSFESLILFGFALGAITLHISGFMEWVFRITPVTFTYAICSGLSVGYAQSLSQPAATTVASKKMPDPKSLAPAPASGAPPASAPSDPAPVASTSSEVAPPAESDI